MTLSVKKIAVGSTNPAKLSSVKQAALALFPDSPNAEIVGFKVPSGVSDQPMSDDECIRGAITRAKNALEASGSDDTDFGVGLEGGVHQINEKWFECGWIAVVDKNVFYFFSIVLSLVLLSLTPLFSLFPLSLYSLFLSLFSLSPSLSSILSFLLRLIFITALCHFLNSSYILKHNRQGKIGLGSSARYEMSPKIMERILKGEELADIMDDLTGEEDVRSKAGAMGTCRE
jgi:non-canonical (house-cleaning) NTP pyrophosphatase